MSARRFVVLVLVAAGILAATVAVALRKPGTGTKPATDSNVSASAESEADAEAAADNGPYPTKPLALNGRTLTLEVADTPARQELGLGKRDSLPADRGMLFAYDKPQAKLCFWMKNMRFAIDIIWLDANKSVVHVESNVKPETYPKSFCPPGPSQYVVEFNAGVAGQLGVKNGTQLAL